MKKNSTSRLRLKKDIVARLGKEGLDHIIGKGGVPTALEKLSVACNLSKPSQCPTQQLHCTTF